jgi:MFS family permease
VSGAVDDTGPGPVASDAVEAVGLAASGGYARLFANRDFRKLWVAQTISGIGDWLVVGLLIPLVTNISNGSSMAVAGIMIAKIIPSLLLGGLLGVAVDRFDRRKLMIACDLINGVLCLGLLFMYSVPPVAALTLIYSITFLMEICNLLVVPAKNALIPALVDERDLAAANGLSYTTQQASMLIGLLGSSAIVATFVAVVRGLVAAEVPLFSAALQTAPYFGILTGPLAGVALDSISFLFSALLIWRMRAHSKAELEGSGGFNLRLFGREVLESFTVLKERRELRGLLVSIGFAILGGGAVVSVGLVYVNDLVGGIPLLELVPPLQRMASQGWQTFMMAFLALGMFPGGAVRRRRRAVRPVDARLRHHRVLRCRRVLRRGVGLLCRPGHRRRQHLHRRDGPGRSTRTGVHRARIGPARRTARIDGRRGADRGPRERPGPALPRGDRWRSGEARHDGPPHHAHPRVDDRAGRGGVRFEGDTVAARACRR